MDDVQTAIADHERTQHANLLPADKIAEMDDAVLKLVGLIADEILGPRKGPLWGPDERDATKGLKARQDTLIQWQSGVQKLLDNGGVPSKLTSKDRATVLAAALGSVSAVVLGLIQFFGGKF